MWLMIMLLFSFSMGSIAEGVWAQPSLFPPSGPPGSTVTISGEDFGQFQSTEANQVLFNDLPALVQRWDTNLIEVKVPHRVQKGAVIVKKGKKHVEVGEFSVQYPTIEGVTPEEIEPGKILQLSGKNFGNTAGAKDRNAMFGVNEVIVGGMKARVTKWRDDKIEVIVPATAKSGEVVVQLGSSDPLPNGFCCAPVEYTRSNPVPVSVLPTIDVDPRTGPVGTKVVLFGEGFGTKPGAREGVFINGQPAALAQWEDRNIVVHVPLNATTGPLVLRRGGKDRNLGTFSVLAPKVTVTQPDRGPVGSLLRIQGENFGNYTESGATPFSFIDFDPGENSVTIGGVPAIVYRWNDDRIDVWVPFSAKSGPVVIRRGGVVPKADGSCCLERGAIPIDAGSFSVVEPRVDSVTPTEAGIDEIVKISGSGFGSFIKGREATDPELTRRGFLRQQIRLGENISRSEVLFNGVAAIVVSWTDTEIKVQVPRRLLYGIGSRNEFSPDLSKGPLVVRRGSWDVLPDGTCCTEKKWISLDAGEFTVLAKGLPDQGFFTDPTQSNP